jgi:hypothetical protein
MKHRLLVVMGLMIFTSILAFATSPQRLQLTNQFGEKSLNYVQGTYLPLPPNTTFNQMVVFSGTTITPTALTGLNVAGTGSLYIGRSTTSYGSSKVFLNIGTITAPSWSKVGP